MEKSANADSIHVRMKMMDLKAPHAAPLVAYADRIAEATGLEPGAVPYPDPEHGGTEAEVLFVLSHASERAIRSRGGSGLLSLENDDHPARNCFDQCRRIGLDVGRLTLWNAVPQPLPERRDPRVAEVLDGAQWLPGLIELLPKLRIVVLFGRNAEKAWDATLSDSEITPLRGPSPGRQGAAVTEASLRLDATFDEIAGLLQLV